MIRFVLLRMSCMALPASETRNLIPAEASMIQLMTEQTVYGQKPAMRHIGICRMLSEKRLLRMLRKDREKRQGEYTADDYRKLPEDVRAELIDGVLIFLEAPTFTHQEMVTEILLDFGFYIRKNKGLCRVLPSPLDVQIDCDDRTIVQPDIALICNEERITRKGIYGAPDFCIEIVSDSSRKRDYGIKVQKYMNAGVREYWIVDRKREKIVCYWFEGEDAPEISMYTFRDKVPVRIYDGQLEIDFPGIMQRLWKEE